MYSEYAFLYICLSELQNTINLKVFLQVFFFSLNIPCKFTFLTHCRNQLLKKKKRNSWAINRIRYYLTFFFHGLILAGSPANWWSACYKTELCWDYMRFSVGVADMFIFHKNKLQVCWRRKRKQYWPFSIQRQSSAFLNTGESPLLPGCPVGQAPALHSEGHVKKVMVVSWRELERKSLSPEDHFPCCQKRSCAPPQPNQPPSFNSGL
jgi:hypothetical protein